MRILSLSMVWYPFSSNKHDIHWLSIPSYASRIIFFKFHKVRLIVINPYLLLGGIDSYEPAVIVTDYDVSTIIAIESSESVVNNACVSLMLFVLQRHLMLFSEPLRSKSMVELDSSESLVSTCSSNLRQGTISLLRGWKLHTVTHKNLVILHTKISFIKIKYLVR